MSKTFRELIKEEFNDDNITIGFNDGLAKAQELYGDTQASKVKEVEFEKDVTKIGQDLGLDVEQFVVWMKTQMTFEPAE